MFSLIGLPPFAGFAGKFFIFAAVIKQHYYLLALAGVLNSVISLGYYARVVRTMFLDMPDGSEGEITMSGYDGVLLYSLTAATVILGIYWEPFLSFADRSMQFFLG